jgi:inner membrane protein
MLPDADVLSFHMGIPYEAAFGHRGFSHSILFAQMFALAGAWLLQRYGWRRAFVFLFITTLSHSLLDACTSGGLGVALLWPWPKRYFMPWHPIRVSPLSLMRFLSPRGLAVLKSEFIWIWLPGTTLALAGICWRKLLPRIEDGRSVKELG